MRKPQRARVTRFSTFLVLIAAGCGSADDGYSVADNALGIERMVSERSVIDGLDTLTLRGLGGDGAEIARLSIGRGAIMYVADIGMTPELVDGRRIDLELTREKGPAEVRADRKGADATAINVTEEFMPFVTLPELQPLLAQEQLEFASLSPPQERAYTTSTGCSSAPELFSTDNVNGIQSGSKCVLVYDGGSLPSFQASCSANGNRPLGVSVFGTACQDGFGPCGRKLSSQIASATDDCFVYTTTGWYSYYWRLGETDYCYNGCGGSTAEKPSSGTCTYTSCCSIGGASFPYAGTCPSSVPTFFEDANYGGANTNYGMQYQASLGSWNDRISSVSIPSGITVRLYRDEDFEGGYLLLDGGSVADLSGYGYDDDTSAIDIYNQ